MPRQNAFAEAFVNAFLASRTNFQNQRKNFPLGHPHCRPSRAIENRLGCGGFLPFEAASASEKKINGN